MSANKDRSMVLVTDEIRFERDVAGSVIFLHDGVIVEEGPPDQVIDNPIHERLRAFLNEIVEH